MCQMCEEADRYMAQLQAAARKVATVDKDECARRDPERVDEKRTESAHEKP